MEKNGINYKSWLGARNMRFKEWFIQPGDSVYVLGSAKKTGNTTPDYKKELIRRLEELKKDSQKMKEVDLNKDGTVSEEEWGSAVSNLEREVLQDTLKMSAGDSPADVIISRAEAENVFMISDRSEKELTRKLSQQCILGIYGGAALSLALLGYLLVRLGIVNF
jgi:hypothetical protein